MNKHFTCIGTLILLLALCLLAPARFALAQTSLDWPFYGGDLAHTRYQNVDQIKHSNVANLKGAWIFHTGVLDPKAELEVSPIEVNGTVYITDGHDDVFAVDAVTGSQKWAYMPITIAGEMPPLTSISVCCGRNNRGVVFVPDMGSGAGAVIYGRLDDVVVALDAATGAVLWKTTVANFQDRVAINMAPQLAKGLVFVALDLATGHVGWFFQETHHDLWDYDSTMTTVLFPVEKNGQSIPALGHCSKNGNYYILDRRNGQPVYPVTETPVPTKPAWQHP